MPRYVPIQKELSKVTYKMAVLEIMNSKKNYLKSSSIHWKVSMKDFIFSRVTDVQSVTSLKHMHFYSYILKEIV